MRHEKQACRAAVRTQKLCRQCRLPQSVSDDHDSTCSWHPANRRFLPSRLPTTAALIGRSVPVPAGLPPAELKRRLARFFYDYMRSCAGELAILAIALLSIVAGVHMHPFAFAAIGGTLLKDLSTTFPEPVIHPSVTNGGAVGYVVDQLQRAFWQWYVAHKADVLVQKKLLFWNVKITVAELRSVFVKIFGEAPSDIEGAA